MAWSRRDLFKRDNQKLQVHNPYEQSAQRAGDIQPLYWQVKPLQVENYKSPSSAGDRRMDTIATIWGIATPAGRLEEWVSAIISKAIPMIQKAWPKVAARFANLLTKAKGNPKALTKIATKLDNEMWGMMLRPSQLQKSNPNHLDNINAVSDFKSRPVGELKDKAKIDAWLENKPAYERKAMGKPQANKSRTFEDELEEIHNSYKDRTEYLDGYWQDRDTLMKYEFDARKDIEALGKKYNKEITDEHYPKALTKLAQGLESKIPSYPQGIWWSRNIPSSAKQIEKLSAEYYAKNWTIDWLDDYIDLAIKQGKIKFNSPTTPEAIKARNIEEAFNKSNKPREYKYEDYDFSKPVDFGGVKYWDGPEPGTSLFTKKTRNPQEAYIWQFNNAKGDYSFHPEQRWEYTETPRLPKFDKLPQAPKSFRTPTATEKWQTELEDLQSWYSNEIDELAMRGADDAEVNKLNSLFEKNMKIINKKYWIKDKPPRNRTWKNNEDRVNEFWKLDIMWF